MEKIDFNFDLTRDTKKDFWEAWRGYVDNHIAVINGAASGKTDFVDPDEESATLRKYQRALWSKPLPIEKTMKLVEEGKNLTCEVTVNKAKKKFKFGSDIIATSFIGYAWNQKYQPLFKKVCATLAEPNYRAFVDGYTKQFYTGVGAFVIFPKMSNSLNQVRGTNPLLCDRFDLMLECIRIYYQRQQDPTYAKDLLKNENFRNLYKACFNNQTNKDFFALFGDFKGYVDFFCLQDLVSNDYTYVRDLTRGDGAPVQFWIGTDGNLPDPIPETVDGYMQWMANQLDFIAKRNNRIQEDVLNRNKK